MCMCDGSVPAHAGAPTQVRPRARGHYATHSLRERERGRQSNVPSVDWPSPPISTARASNAKRVSVCAEGGGGGVRWARRLQAPHTPAGRPQPQRGSTSAAAAPQLSPWPPRTLQDVHRSHVVRQKQEIQHVVAGRGGVIDQQAGRRPGAGGREHSRGEQHTHTHTHNKPHRRGGGSVGACWARWERGKQVLALGTRASKRRPRRRNAGAKSVARGER